MGADKKSLDEAKATLIRCWGEMAPYWGISRTMAEVHALLFICPRALCTDEIMAELSISRGNASMTLHSLLDWGLVRRVHQKGDRKEYFICDASVWTIFETIARQRKRREVEPIFSTLSRCCDLARGAEQAMSDPQASKEAQRCRVRLEEMVDFLHILNRLGDSFLEAGPTVLRDLSLLLGERKAGDDAEQPGG
jgi:HTH-type transcriptional regulator, glycine betaine synthesis regulator